MTKLQHATRFLLLGTLVGSPAFAAPAVPPPTKIEGATIDRWDEAAMAKIVPTDWKIEKLAEGFTWAEGPLWIKAGGYLLFNDVPSNKMWKWSAKGGLQKFMDPSGAVRVDTAVWREAGANGMAPDGKDTVLVADTGNRGIQRLNLKTKKKTPVAMAYDGKKLSSPNDVIRTKAGVVFFTDPPYGFKKFDDAPEKQQAFNGVYRVGKDGKVTVIDKTLQRPNGVALSPDESILYVAQSEPTKPIIMAYTLDKDANTTGKILFADFSDLVAADAPGLPDGIAVATDGTLFTGGPGGVIVLSSEGRRLGRIRDGKPTANCKFGDDGRTLYLTSQDMLARIRLNVLGAGFERK
jgi:gluconolactonase